MSQTQTTNTVEQTGAEAVQVLGSQATSTQEAPQPKEQEVVVQPTTSQEPKEGTPEWATKRFAELTSQREEAKRIADDNARERDFYKKLALEKSSQPSGDVTAAPVSTEPVEPKIEDFTDYGDFVKASVNYQIGRELRNLQSQMKQTQTKEERTKQFHSSAEAFKKETPDFDAVITHPAFVQTETVVEAILHSKKGPQIAYFLAKNPDVSSRLNSLSPFEVALEIGRMEERLTPLTPKVVTSTPKPLENLTGKTGDVDTFDPNKASMEEYAAKNAHRFEWKGKKAR